MMAESVTPDEYEAMEALLLLRYQDPVFVFVEDEDEDEVEEDEEEEDEEEEDEEEEDEEDEDEEEEEEFVSEDGLEEKMCSQTKKRKDRKKNKTVKEDDSEETLQHMLQWKANTPEKPPRSIFVGDPDVVGDCSKPFRKQLMESDVLAHHCRLLLGKEPVKTMMADVLGKTDKLGVDGLDVLVYGPQSPDVKTHGTHDMVFKMWGKRKDTPVLKSAGWKKFVEAYDLKMHCDFLTIWMFRHKKNHRICFAIDRHTYPAVDGKLSKRISKATFSNS